MSGENTPDPDALAELSALRPPTPPPLSPVLEAELAKLAPVATRRPIRQLALLLGVSLAYAAVILAVLAVRDDAAELPPGWLIGVAVGWSVGFLVSCHAALVPREGTITPSWRLAGAAAIVVAIGFVVLGLALHPAGAHSVQYGAPRFLHGHYCLEIGLATALVPVVIGALMLRGAMPVGARWLAAALGAGGGSLGGLVLHLHCHITDALHMGLIHGGVVVVAALLSAALVPGDRG